MGLESPSTMVLQNLSITGSQSRMLRGKIATHVRVEAFQPFGNLMGADDINRKESVPVGPK